MDKYGQNANQKCRKINKDNRVQTPLNRAGIVHGGIPVIKLQGDSKVLLHFSPLPNGDSYLSLIIPQTLKKIDKI